MLAEKGLNAPPERRFRDKPLTFLERMSVQLRENNVLATGRLRTEFIGIDHSIDVDLVLQAEATKGALAFRLIDSSVDSTSVLVDAAEFFGEGIIGRTLRDEVRATLDGAAAASIDPDALVGDLSAGPFTVFADGRVEHRADGIGIPFTVAGLSQRVATPPYARGHRLSREVHLPSGCRYGDAIADRSLRKFATPEQAIAAGYDGCASCLPALNNWDEGRAYVTASGPDDGTVPTVVLRIAPGAVRSGIPLDALEEPVPLRKTGQVRGIAVFGGTLKGLVPGEWDVDNRWGGHQHVQRVTISPVQRTDSTGAGTRLNYLRGEDRLIVDPTS
ncbi:hypothetical protein [Agromyces sp. PvR057]|uniref:hypothetical protein n=1 Tax=Agromyces sp. PvR057 TaxID=3156403 RepID=UPI003397D32E